VDAAFFARLPSGRAADDVEKNARCRILRQKEIVCLAPATSDFKYLWRSSGTRRGAQKPAQLFIISSGVQKNTADFGWGRKRCPLGNIA
jgi:hypothetical protein